MDEATISACEGRVWQALRRRKGWTTVGRLACRANVAPQTAWTALARLAAAGLVHKIRVGLPCYYRAADGREALAHDKRAVLALSILRSSRRAC